MITRRILLWLLGWALVLAVRFSTEGDVSLAKAQSEPNPPCQFAENTPYHDINKICIEIVFDEIEPPEAAPELSELFFSQDNTLYFIRTSIGQIWSLRDKDRDGQMDEPFLVVDNLRFPISAAIKDGSLYVATVDEVLRFDNMNEDGRFDSSSVLIHLPVSQTGFWPGSLGIGPDNRLYISLGANCFACEGPNIQPGELLSYRLDGSDQRVEASGFRYPADFAWDPRTNELWIVDSGNVTYTTLDGDAPDELNRVKPEGDYGFPACYGAQMLDTALALNGYNGDCSSTIAPDFTFPHQSTPSGMLFYSGDAFADWDGDLVVVLAGSWSLPEPAGYALTLVEFDESGNPSGTALRIVPSSENPIYAYDSLSEFSLSGRGFFPYHPVDIALSKEGWIYVALQEGRILRLRPLPTN